MSKHRSQRLFSKRGAKSVMRAESAAETASWPEPFLDVLLVLIRSRFTIAILGMLGVATASAWLVATPVFYRAGAVAVLMPREKPYLDVSVKHGALETGRDQGAQNRTGTMMLPAQPDLYMQLLGSRRVLASLLDRFLARLGPGIQELDREEQIAKLSVMVKVIGTEEGLLMIDVRAPSPDLAADLANALVSEGERVSRLIEGQLVMSQVLHLEGTIDATRLTLSRSEEELAVFCRKHQIVDPALESSDVVRQIRETQMKVIHDRMQLARRLETFTDSDHGVAELHASIETGEARIKELQSAVIGRVPRADFGRLMVDYDNLRQRVRARRDMLQTLIGTHSVLKVRAQEPIGNIVSLRLAQAPSLPAGPSKKRAILVGLAGGLAIGVLLAVLREQWRRACQDRGFLARVQLARSELRLRPSRRKVVL